MMINNTCKYTCGCAHYHQVDRHLDLIGIFTHRQGARPWESGAKPCPKGPGGPFTRRLINTHLHPHQSSPSPSTRRINSLVSPRINDKANACRTQILPRRAVQRSVPWAVNGGSTLCQRHILREHWQLICLSSAKALNSGSPVTNHRNYMKVKGAAKVPSVSSVFWCYFHQVTWDIHRSR